MDTFIKSALIRAIRTICQTAIATIGTAFVIADVNWGVVISASILAGILSVLTSVATGLPEVELINDLEDDDDFDFEDDEEFMDEVAESGMTLEEYMKKNGIEYDNTLKQRAIDNWKKENNDIQTL